MKTSPGGEAQPFVPVLRSTWRRDPPLIVSDVQCEELSAVDPESVPELRELSSVAYISLVWGFVLSGWGFEE